ncbi:MAG: hypothetical protein SF053_05215 [Bacteroidia bacterium]|nr:hypothetical protein [Bacteroidia bacterium]
MTAKHISPQEINRNLIVYAVCMILAVIGMGYGHVIKAQYPLLRVWDYPAILMLLAGVPFLWVQTQAGIPNFLDNTVSGRQRWVRPALIGAGFGILDVMVIKCLLHPEPYTEWPPFIQPFPYSLFLYFSGAFEIEVFYRLIPLTIMLLAGTWVANGKYANIFFVAGAALTALREPLEQWPDGALWFVVYAWVTGFGMNYCQALYLKNAGFLASLTLRLGHYVCWHILLGIYIQYVELA